MTMSLPDATQQRVDELRALLGIPPSSQIVLNVDHQGIVVCVEVKTVFRRQKAVDIGRPVSINGRAS